MAELRKDYLLDCFVIISKERGKRPDQFKKLNVKDSINYSVKVDFFAPGNEGMTPVEIGRKENKLGWYIRWFENKFPAVDMCGNDKLETHNEFFTFSNAVGKHEVIVETPNIDEELCDLPLYHLKDLLIVYGERIEALDKEEGYVCVFKNHGEKAGTSIIHPHSQIIAYNLVPKIVKDKVIACKNYEIKFNEDPYSKIIEIEKTSHRKVFENDTFVCFCPYASKYPMEIIFLPKRYVGRLNELKEFEIFDLAELIKKVITKLKRINVSYNLYVHYAPKNEKLRLQIIICPRISNFGGFEISSDTIINSISPEDAARFYRE